MKLTQQITVQIASQDKQRLERMRRTLAIGSEELSLSRVVRACIEAGMDIVEKQAVSK